MCGVFLKEKTDQVRTVKKKDIYIKAIGSFRVRSTNGLRVTPPISMKFGTLADSA